MSDLSIDFEKRHGKSGAPTESLVHNMVEGRKSLPHGEGLPHVDGRIRRSGPDDILSTANGSHGPGSGVISFGLSGLDQQVVQVTEAPTSIKSYTPPHARARG